MKIYLPKQNSKELIGCAFEKGHTHANGFKKKSHPPSIISNANRIILQKNYINSWGIACLRFINSIIQNFIHLQAWKLHNIKIKDKGWSLLWIYLKQPIAFKKIPGDANHEVLCYQYTFQVSSWQDLALPTPEWKQQAHDQNNIL